MTSASWNLSSGVVKSFMSFNNSSLDARTSLYSSCRFATAVSISVPDGAATSWNFNPNPLKTVSRPFVALSPPTPLTEINIIPAENFKTSGGWFSELSKASCIALEPPLVLIVSQYTPDSGRPFVKNSRNPTILSLSSEKYLM